MNYRPRTKNGAPEEDRTPLARSTIELLHQMHTEAGRAPRPVRTRHDVKESNPLGRGFGGPSVTVTYVVCGLVEALSLCIS